MKKIYFFTAWLFVALAVGVFLWLLNNNVPGSVGVTYRATLGVDTPAISRLGPDPRVVAVNEGQAIVDSPVYFDVRTVRWLDSATVTLEYRESPRALTGIGGKVGEPWNYNIKQPISVTPLEAGWQRAIFWFNFDELLSAKNVKRFVIDSSGEPGEKLEIRLLEIHVK